MGSEMCIRDRLGCVWAMGIVGFVWFGTGLVSLVVFTVLLLAMAVIKVAF